MRVNILFFRNLISRHVLRQLFERAFEELTQLVENVCPRDVSADIRHARQGHSVKPGFSRDLFHRHDSAQAERAVGDEFFQAVADHCSTSVDE